MLYHNNLVIYDIHNNIFNKAKSFLDKNTYTVNSWEEFTDKISQGGFVYAHWDGTSETEELIKQKTKATIRCIPLNSIKEQGNCLFSGNKSEKRVIFAKAY